MSLCNRMAERRGQQNICVWQGYHLCVFSWFSLYSVTVFWFFTKRSAYWKVKFGIFFFKHNYCHSCHTRFTIFFPLPSCCVSSLLSDEQLSLLVCTWRYGSNVGGQEQKNFSPLGTELYVHLNSSRKNSIVLTLNMAALKHNCKPRIDSSAGYIYTCILGIQNIP